CWAVFGCEKFVEGTRKRIEIVGIANMGHMPAIRSETHANVFAERPVSRAVERDLVGIVDPAKVRQLQMSSERGGLAAHAFHQVTITAKCVNVVVEKFQPWTVVACH